MNNSMLAWNTASGYKIYQIDGNSKSFVVNFEINFFMVDTGKKLKLI